MIKELDFNSISVEYEPPFPLTINEALNVMQYMDKFYRAQDVLERVKKEDYFIKLSREEKLKFVYEVAEDANDLIETDEKYWLAAIDEAINERMCEQ